MKKHIIMLSVTIVGWLFFFLVGLPFNYFLNTSTLFKILVLWMTMFSIFPVITFILLSFLEGDFFRNSLWFSLYASFGVFLLDLIVVGIINQNVLVFLKTHWMQTVGYLEALIIIPLTGLAMKKIYLRKLHRNDSGMAHAETPRRREQI